jgi:hypothetical protein
VLITGAAHPVVRIAIVVVVVVVRQRGGGGGGGVDDVVVVIVIVILEMSLLDHAVFVLRIDAAIFLRTISRHGAAIVHARPFFAASVTRELPGRVRAMIVGHDCRRDYSAGSWEGAKLPRERVVRENEVWEICVPAAMTDKTRRFCSTNYQA